MFVSLRIICLFSEARNGIRFSELDEELLQLLVAVIDAELLKAVRETEASSVL